MGFIQDFKNGAHPYQQEIQSVLYYLRDYLKNPVLGIKNIPNWSWQTLLITYSASAGACGLLSGIVSRKFFMMFVGLFFLPIVALVSAALIAGFFYYTFLFFFHRELEYKKLYTIVALSMLPFYALYTVAGLIPPITLLGFAVAGLLLAVGLTENTPIERKYIFRLVGGLYAIYFLFWLINMIQWENETKEYKDVMTPSSYEQLSKELQK